VKSSSATRLPAKGDLFDRTYIEVEVIEPEGEVVDREIFTYAGVRPPIDAIPPEWGASDK
jgi:hypothetical protein